MHTLVVAPKTSKEATLAATRATIDPTIDPAIVPLPEQKKLSSRRVAYGQNSDLSQGAQWPC
jgi:hypothetical protein